jgi:hypothetical protein
MNGIKEYKKLEWGTFGKKNIHHPRYKLVTLGDCSTEHLKNILETQHQIPRLYKKAIFCILRHRQSKHIDYKSEANGYDTEKAKFVWKTI